MKSGQVLTLTAASLNCIRSVGNTAGQTADDALLGDKYTVAVVDTAVAVHVVPDVHAVP
jgi:hypothetical protein